jgi:ABC-2 type transport system ATP-binding protein
MSDVTPLAFERVSRWYGPVIALNDVTVNVGPGVVGLLGPNGAGKSTFLRLAAGQLSPSQGAVRVFDRPAWGTPEIFHRIGLAPDEGGFWEHVTGRDFVASLLRLYGYSEEESKRRAADALAQMQLEPVQDRRVGGYSKGMRQRLKLAQAIAHDPDLLLLDEPLTGLDPLNRRQVIDRVKAWGRAGKTVLISSHVLHEVEAMTRSVVLIHKGRIAAHGEVAEIRGLLDQHPHSVAVRARDPRGLARALVERPCVLSVRFAADGEWLTFETPQPDVFYAALTEQAPEHGVREMFALDDDLESVFRYLVKD